MRTEDLTESVAKDLAITRVQADELVAVGRRLAATSTWWGATDDDIEPRSVVACHRTSPTKYRVTVRDAIGVVAVTGLQLNVQPKIPLDHFLYLAEQSELVPRLDEQRAHLAVGDNLWELMARWFLTSLEAVLRSDLIRDYHSHTEQRPFVTGRVVALPTARDYYTGRTAFTCEFELFDTDTPINRVLRAAATSVLSNPMTTQLTRRQARRLVAAMNEVGRLRPGDLDARPDPRMSRYRDAHILGRQILSGQLRQLHGNDTSAAWSFLLRTPDLVEAGIRKTLDRLLSPEHRVHKTGKGIPRTKFTLQPDLVFDDDYAVGDVKYKLITGSWSRNDLYQVTAFATGYRTNLGAVVSFDDRPTGSPLPDLQLGDVTLRSLRWRCGTDTKPTEAEGQLAYDCLQWLSAASAEDQIGATAILAVR